MPAPFLQLGEYHRCQRTSQETALSDSSMDCRQFSGFFINGLVNWAIANLCEDIHVTRCCLESLKLEKK